MKKQKNKQEPEESSNYSGKTRVTVSSPLITKNLTSTLDFEWPEFSKERDRIKAYSKRYADTSFAKLFGASESLEDATPTELKVGDRINVHILSVTSSGVVFDGHCTKQVINAANNLYKYERFRHVSADETFEAEVVRANRNEVYVDIIKPVFDKWVNGIVRGITSDNDVQRNIKSPMITQVKNLQLTRGGFIGQAVINVLSELVGQQYTVEAFIPGSQIVLNIEEDFSRWNGKTVDAFVTNYMIKPGTTQMSLICSRKELLKFYGDMNITKIFDSYCAEGDLWKEIKVKNYDGVVTGIINSSKKCGVFVEIPELFLTGMINVPANELVNFKPRDKVLVRISNFEENTYFDIASKQMRHDAPYIIEDDILKSCDVKPILTLVTK